MWLAAPETLADIVVNRKSNNSKIVIDGAYIRS